MLELSADEARRLALKAQGVLGAADKRGGAPALLQRMAAVQLDTISVLARSHELVAYTRLGAIPRGSVEAAYWSGDAFEYWAHAACVIPVAQWPLFAFRRRRYRARGWRWHEVDEAACDRVLQRLRDDGPLTTTELGGAKRSGEWWDWSEAKIAVEFMLDVGDVVCVERRNWKRVYDLPERALPAEVLAVDEPSTEEECFVELVGIAGRALGVATVGDLADFHRVTQVEVKSVLQDSGLVRVGVKGWGEDAWADPDLLDEGMPRGRHRTALVSPFDPLVWHRPRTERIFDFTHRIEAYTPAPKRVHGYFPMPVLGGGKLVGRVDPKRDGKTLIARQVSFAPRDVGYVATALREAAEWVGCDSVVVERCDPSGAHSELSRLLQ